jgi:hypothetical protein
MGFQRIKPSDLTFACPEIIAHQLTNLVCSGTECAEVGPCVMQVIMEGPEPSHVEAQARLTTCMQEPFVKDRAVLHHFMNAFRPLHRLTDEQLESWDSCYHCGMRLNLTVDSKVAKTWYDAK